MEDGNHVMVSAGLRLAARQGQGANGEEDPENTRRLARRSNYPSSGPTPDLHGQSKPLCPRSLSEKPRNKLIQR